MDILVIGAGVVGLAAARALALAGHSVIVAERTGGIGNGVSSRNSEVIHGGIYYSAGSLRARHCIDGAGMLYAFCESHGVPYRKSGKLIVAATEAEEAKVESLFRQGLANGAPGLSLLSGARARDLEPSLSCTAALLSERTGIVDSHALMLALQGDLEAAGGVIAFHAPVEHMGRTASGWQARIGGSDPMVLSIDGIVNAAGLGAQALARATDSYPAERVPRLVLAKGNYFACSGKPAFTRLIYPAPQEGGLGIHLTLDLAGRMRFGPDVEWIDREIYDVDARRMDDFYASIRRYWPALPDGALTPDYAGIRPKLTGPGEAVADFLIDGPEQHNLPGLVHLFGIESPGLTSCLSLGDEVAARLIAAA